MEVLGSKETFAFVIGPDATRGTRVEIWAGDECLTPVDVWPHIPAFLHHLELGAKRLRAPASFARHEDELQGLSAEGAFNLLTSDGAPGLQAALRVLDWGPTTDDVVCFLVPSAGQLCLTWKLNAGPVIRSLPIEPSELAYRFDQARERLSTP